MFNKTKISIIVLALALFLVSGFVFTVYQVGAFGNGDGHEFGFWKGEFSGIDKNSEEWQVKIEEWKSKMEEFKLSKVENGEEWEGHDWGSGHSFGFKAWEGYSDEINYDFMDIDDGIQVTITSDNSDIVQKLQDIAAKKRSYLNK